MVKILRNFERFVVTKFCHYPDYPRALSTEEPRDHIMLYDWWTYCILYTVYSKKGDERGR